MNWTAEAGMAVMLAILPAGAACHGRPVVVIDAGLRRQWMVERDCAHPQRPGRLVEIPWNDAAAAGTARPSQSRGELLVRPGMHVMVEQQGAQAMLELEGTALEGGRAGDTIWIRAGLHGALLRGILRGPGRAELVSGKER